MLSEYKKLKILKKALGHCWTNGSEHLFHCPKCNHHKKKLSVNVEKGVFKCWICDFSGKKITSLLRNTRPDLLHEWSVFEEHVDLSKYEDLLKKHNFLDLDLLYIDAEGYDGEIILELMKKVNIKPLIIFEYIHIDHVIFKEVIELLDQKNYKIIKCNENVIAINKEIQVDL